MSLKRLLRRFTKRPSWLFLTGLILGCLVVAFSSQIAMKKCKKNSNGREISHKSAQIKMKFSTFVPESDTSELSVRAEKTKQVSKDAERQKNASLSKNTPKKKKQRKPKPIDSPSFTSESVDYNTIQLTEILRKLNDSHQPKEYPLPIVKTVFVPQPQRESHLPPMNSYPNFPQSQFVLSMPTNHVQPIPFTPVYTQRQASTFAITE